MPKVDGGKTVRIVLRGCGETAAGGLSDQGFVEWSAIELCRVLGMTAIGDTVTRVIAPGLSTVLVIAESHIAIHTWPESSSVRVIIDSCVDFNDKAAAEWLNDTFSSAAYNVFLV
jgi:S-adenosylmethionine/arginine decarboxylase-like enzyme